MALKIKILLFSATFQISNIRLIFSIFYPLPSEMLGLLEGLLHPGQAKPSHEASHRWPSRVRRLWQTVRRFLPTKGTPGHSLGAGKREEETSLRHLRIQFEGREHQNWFPWQLGQPLPGVSPRSLRHLSHVSKITEISLETPKLEL